MKFRKLGDFIERIEDKNSDNLIPDVMGMSVNKEFRSAKSTVNKDELSAYRIVRHDQFAFVQTTNNEKVLIVALSKFRKPIVVSSVNIVFKINKPQELLSDYLYVFFKRNEFDRYARFHSWGSVRETFDWDDMCNVDIPVPKIE